MSRKNQSATSRAKRKGERGRRGSRSPAAAQDNASDAVPAAADEGIADSGLSLHDLFAQQAREMIERADLNEEQKQSILVAMSCPCCGGGGMSYSVKLKRRS
jgi:hypothetical protein